MLCIILYQCHKICFGATSAGRLVLHLHVVGLPAMAYPDRANARFTKIILIRLQVRTEYVSDVPYIIQHVDCG